MTVNEKRHQPAVNVHRIERIFCAATGGALIASGLRKRGWSGFSIAALGGALLYRGALGRSALYRLTRFSTARSRSGRNVSVPYEQGVRVDKSITIAKSPEEVYRFWRNLENLPRFMRHLQSVTETDNKYSHWVAEGPAGTKLEWQAEIINDIENSLIAWRSLHGADVDNAGSVHFKPLPDGSGTQVLLEFQYYPPGGALGAAVAKLWGADPAAQAEEDLKCLKDLLETGRSDEVCVPKKKSGFSRDAVGMASEESFPASDPPSWTPEALAH